MMKLSDKLVGLRKSAGMSQEELAEKLNVSRQAVSRWEMGTAMPDAVNILQLSKLFHVTTDYLLNEEYESDADLPQVRAVKADGVHQGMILLVTLEVMSLILQFTAAILLQSTFFTVLSFLPFVAAIGGFEYAYQKKRMRRMKNKTVSQALLRDIRVARALFSAPASGAGVDELLSASV